MEPSRPVELLSQSVFAYISKAAPHGSADDQGHIHRIVMSELFDFVGMAFVVAAHDCITLNETEYLRVFSSALGVLAPPPWHLWNRLEDCGFFDLIPALSINFFRIPPFFIFRKLTARLMTLKLSSGTVGTLLRQWTGQTG